MQYIPRIWADTVLSSLHKHLLFVSEEQRKTQEEHERRMREDLTYAKAYMQRMAEEEAESHWDALYENAYPPEEEIDEW